MLDRVRIVLSVKLSDPVEQSESLRESFRLNCRGVVGGYLIVIGRAFIGTGGDQGVSWLSSNIDPVDLLL